MARFSSRDRGNAGGRQSVKVTCAAGVAPVTGDARLYRLALERNAQDARYHAAENRGTPFRAIAETIGRRLGLPVASLTPDEAPAHFGWLSPFAMLDNPTSSDWTRATLGWAPTQPDLPGDLDSAAYFA